MPETNSPATEPQTSAERPRPQSWRLPLVARWLIGGWLVLICGWGFIGLTYYFTKSYDVAGNTALVVSSLLDLGFFILLERNLWFSRFLGVPVSERSSPLKSAVLLWLFGVIFLIVRAMGTASPEVRATTEAKPAQAPTEKPKPDELDHKDSIREAIETVVFVVFLVLLLMSFVAQAFVIPTGSMATTLLGVHRGGKCEKCAYEFLVNDRDVEEGVGGRHDLEGVCPICNHLQRIQPQGLTGGDKVLVNKAQYEIFKPQRLEVIVFKFPGERDELGRWKPHEGGPQKDYQAHNFIKRLYGLPGEKLAIGAGDVYLVESDGKLSIIRKSPRLMLEMRRVVHDNDYHPSDLKGRPGFQRWSDENPGPGWQSSEDGKSFALQATEAYRWLHYRHRLPRDRGDRLQPVNAQLITDMLDYNGGDQYHHWIDDLMLDFEIDIEQAQGELTLELLAGMDANVAVFNLETGECTLKAQRNGVDLLTGEAKANTRLNRPGKHHVRFANFDDRLTVWVDGDLPFDGGAEFAGQKWSDKGPRVSDLRPAGIGVKNASVKVRRLQVWRDIYYTKVGSDMAGVANAADTLSLTPEEEQRLVQEHLSSGAQATHEARRLAAQRAMPKSFDGRPRWPKDYYETSPEFYPQVKPWHPGDRFGPDEYFALGDNSTRSKDSRAWGQIPERLLLGRAVSVYWPLNRFGLIR